MNKDRPSEESLARQLELAHENLIARTDDNSQNEVLPGQAMLRLLKQVKDLEQRPGTEKTVEISQEQTAGTSTESHSTPWELDSELQSIGRFEILRLIGQGGFGLVFLAHDPELGRDVALKIPRAQTVMTREMRERFLREGRSTASLSHPNIVPVYEAGRIDEVCFIASQFVPGETLVDVLARRVPIPVDSVARVIAVLAEAVGHAHQRGILHRDIKPANILVQKTDEDVLLESRVMLTDFGLAKDIDDENGFTKTDVLVGTPAYMSPEQIGDHEKVGPRSDVYSLGALLYELLAGQPAFKRDSVFRTIEAVKKEPPPRLKQFNGGVALDLEAICFKALEKDPDARYQTAFELKDDLLRWVEGKPVIARKLNPVTRFVRQCQRFPVVSSLVAAMVLMSAASFAWILGEKNKTYQNFLAAQTNAAAALKAEQDAKTAYLLAEKNLKRAEMNFDRSRAAVGKLLTEVGDQLRDVPHAQSVRRNILKGAKDYFMTLTNEESSDPDVRLDSARAFESVAAVHSKLFEFEEAESAIKKAIKHYQELLELDANPRVKRGLASSLSRYSDFLAQQSKFDQAIEEAMLSHEHWDKYFESVDEPEVDAQSEHGTALFSTATIHGIKKQHEQAIALYEKIISTYEQVSKNSNELIFRLLIPRCYNNLGNQYRRIGNIEEANELVLQASMMLERLLDEFPDNPKLLETFSHNLFACGDAVGGEEGEMYTTRSLEVTERLVKNFPAIVRHRQSLGLANAEFAMKLKSQDRIQEAEKYLNRAYKVMGGVYKEFPSVQRNANNLAFTANELAKICSADGRKEQAVELLTVASETESAIFKRLRTRKSAVKFAKRQIELAKQLIEIGRYSAAMSCVEPLDEDHSQKITCVFLSAEIFARTYVAIKQDKELDGAERELLQKDCFDGALERLSRCTKLGSTKLIVGAGDHSHWDDFRETEIFQDLMSVDDSKQL